MRKIIFILAILAFANVAFADNYTLEVNGMKCEFCGKHLEKELHTLEGVDSVKIDLEAKLVHLGLAKGQELQREQLEKTIGDAGFALVNVVKPATQSSAQ